MLGAVLLGGEEAVGVALAGVGRAGDRIQLGDPVLGLDERLGRGAHERQLVQLEQEQVGRGIHAAQRAVEVDGARLRRPLSALREDDLEGVARADVPLRLLDALLVLEAAWRAAGRPAFRACAVLPVLEGGLEECGDLVRIPGKHLRQPEHMVEADQRVGDDEAAFGEVRALVGKLHGRLERGGVVVAEVADDRHADLLGAGEIHEPRAEPDEGMTS